MRNRKFFESDRHRVLVAMGSQKKMKTAFYGLIFLTFISVICFTVFKTMVPKGSSVLVKRFASENETIEVKRQKKIVIIYWTKLFKRPPRLSSRYAWPFFHAGDNCPTPCELTTDKRRVHEASALVVHVKNADEIPPKIYKNLTWILNSNENPTRASKFRDATFMGQFNYSATYRLDSDFPCPSFLKPKLDPPTPFSEKKGLVIVVYSNCEPVRTRYIAELMKYIQVDSYGKCLKNKDGLVKGNVKGAGQALVQLQGTYKFAIVFPNADCDFYLTEKIYNALSSGAVPIWLGTDGIDEVLKWGNLQHSVIKVKDFASPKALAEFLLKLAENEAEYNKYLKWKYEGFQFPKEYYESAIGEWWDGKLPLYCRVCMRIAVDPGGHHGLPVDNCDGKQKRTNSKWLSKRPKKIETKSISKA